MSGGHFDYAYCHVARFAEELDRDLHSDVADTHMKGFVKELSSATISALESVAKEAELLARKMRAVEWLFSGDTGEESFLKEIIEAQPKE